MLFLEVEFLFLLLVLEELSDLGTLHVELLFVLELLSVVFA
jgi:hypothetical protein